MFVCCWKSCFFRNPPLYLVKLRFLEVRDPMHTLFWQVFRCFLDLTFDAKTTDFEFYLQITALSGPRACLGHSNHHEKSSIVHWEITENEVPQLIFPKQWLYLVKSMFLVSNGAPKIMKTNNKITCIKASTFLMIC